MRTGGQLGQPLYSEVTINTFIADALLKYRGWALSSEYLQRMVDDPITMNSEGDVRYVYTGWGVNAQLSYLLPSNYEIAGRYTRVRPGTPLMAFERPIDEAMAVVTRYVNGHRVKLQLMTGYRWHDGAMSLSHARNRWQGMFQVEFGI